MKLLLAPTSWLMPLLDEMVVVSGVSLMTLTLAANRLLLTRQQAMMLSA